MPIRLKEDKNGTYYQYGSRGAKYYFNLESKRLMDIAYKKCVKQVIAIYARKFSTI
jgi:hypothetical protein